MKRLIITIFTISNFILTGFLPYSNALAQEELILPPVGQILPLSSEFNPVIIKGLKINKEDPFRFDFIINQSQEKLSETQFKEESLKLVKYFLASLAIPEDDLWVNLSPYEKNRITTPELGATGMGKDLLSQDYVLKQLTSSLIYPESEIGKRFWTKVYALAEKKYNTTNIPINTFNKVWIVPQKAVVYENSTSQTAFVVESKLKVLLEEDYLALQKHSGLFGQGAIVDGSQTSGSSTKQSQVNNLGSQIVREIVIPELTKEVNTGKNFANLRQITNSLILAAWFKRALKASILSRLYVDQKKIAGVDLEDKTVTERIFQQYLKAYKKGVYNYIKEEEDPVSHEMIPRKYFSGGYKAKFKVGDNLLIKNFVNPAQVSEVNDADVTVKLNDINDFAMNANEVQQQRQQVFSSLTRLTQEQLLEFGESLNTADTQRRFAQKYQERIQQWLAALSPDVLNSIISNLDKPESDERYRRNLIFPPIKTPLGQIALFIHVANPLKGVPPHFHGDNETGGFAWIVPLNTTFIEEKWLGLPSHRGQKVIELNQADVIVRKPGIVYHLVDDDGPHIMLNSSVSEFGAFLELYILPPNGIKGFDIPVPQLRPDNKTNSIIPQVNANRLLTYDNFEVAARNGGWREVSNKDVDTIDYILHNPEAVVFQVVQGVSVVIPQENLDRNFLKNAPLILRDPEQPRLFYVFDKAMTSVSREASRTELLNPKRTFITADGITRDGFYTFKQEDLPQEPVDVVIIGAGAAGLATGIQAVDNNLKTVVLEGGYVAQSFSDAFMNFWRMRTPAFRFSLVQKGFNSTRLQYLNLINSDVLLKFRKLALKAENTVRLILNKNFSIAQPAGYDNPTNATVPLARAEAFQHFLAVANAIVERGGLIRETDPVKSVKKRRDGIFEITTKKGITVLAKNVVYATGLGNEQVAEILNSLLLGNPNNCQSISNPGEIPANGVDHTKLPVLNSQVLNDPRVVEFVQSLPQGSSIGIVGGGQSAGNSVAFIHSIRPDIIVHIFTKNTLKVHGSQMPAGFRKAHLMWEYVNDENLRKESWGKGGPEAVDTPITPPIFNHINATVENGTTVVHVLGKYFDSNNYEIQTEGNIAKVIDKDTDKEIAQINHGGFISATGFTLKSPQRNALYRDAEENNLIQIDSNGIIKVDPQNGLTSTLDPHVYPAGIQLLTEGAVTDGSTHGTVVRARAIVENIINGKTPRLPDEERIRNAKEDYEYFLNFLGNLPDSQAVAAFLVLAKAQAGETLESILNKYKRALEINTPIEAARATADVAGQTGKDIVQGSTYQIPDYSSKDVIVDRVFATDMPGFLPQQNGKGKISQLFDEVLSSKTSGDFSATEQLLYPATEYGVGKEKAFKLYDTLRQSYTPEVAAILTRAAVSYLPFRENIKKDNAQVSIDHPLSVEQKKLDPGGIDLNTANLDLQIKRDGHGFPLPAAFQNLESIHINGLSPIIINIAPITNLSEFLGVKYV